MVPLLLLICISIVPTSLLGSYWKSFTNEKMHGFLTNRFGEIQPGYENFGNLFGQTSATLGGYELIPIAFLIGWIDFFVVSASILAIAGAMGKSEELYGLSINIGFIVGMVGGAILVIVAFLINWPNMSSTESHLAKVNSGHLPEKWLSVVLYEKIPGVLEAPGILIYFALP